MSRKMTCILVDDDETSRFIITNLANKNDNIQLVKSCSNAREARETLDEQDIDLMLLDIEMPYENGIDMLEKLDKKPQVIFITSQTKHAIKAFEFDAIDYIVKPLDYSRLNEALEKAKRRIFGLPTENVENLSDEFLLIKNNRETQKMCYNQIHFIEGSSSYVTYHASEGKITTTGILKQIEETINTQVFVRVHRSFLVNINKIVKISSEEVLVLQQSLPLSRKYRKEAILKFNELNQAVNENSVN
jgi:two-component system LytT family response regulator